MANLLAFPIQRFAERAAREDEFVRRVRAAVPEFGHVNDDKLRELNRRLCAYMDGKYGAGSWPKKEDS